MTDAVPEPARPPGDVDLAKLDLVPTLLIQAAALAWMPPKADQKFALVTSRRTGRWVFPKGSIDPGMTPAQAAQQEALEESGLVGTVEEASIGRYRTFKIRPPQYWEVEVALYPIRINDVFETWMEIDQRQRRFVTLDEARGVLADPNMLALAERFFATPE